MSDVTFNIRKVRLVAVKKPASENMECELCKLHLNRPSTEDIQNKTYRSSIVIGKCKHGFHESCIRKWQRDGSSICPVDKTAWAIHASTAQKIGTIKLHN